MALKVFPPKNTELNNFDDTALNNRVVSGPTPDVPPPTSNGTPTGGGGGAGGGPVATSGVPSGCILMWAGTLASIPSGWFLCDGTNGTPDLRDRFIKGAPAATNPGGTGGAATHTPAGTNSAPAFTGTGGTTGSTSAGTPAGTIDIHTSATDTALTGAGKRLTGPDTHTFTGSALAGHTHSVTPVGTVAAPVFTGTSASYEPAYFKLAFIQKS